jgi:hypothetical protein
MNRNKIVVLLLLVIAFIAIGHHQLMRISTQALNTNLVPLAYAQASPGPSPSPSPSPRQHF